MIVLKSPREIATLREAGRVVAQVLARLEEALHPGMRTQELDDRADHLIRAAGGVPAFKGYRGFPASICVSVNDEVVHGIPGRRQLRQGDLVSIDVGVILDGFVGDGAWTFGVGPLAPEAVALLDATRRSLDFGIAAARSGGRLSDISHAVQVAVEAAGYSVVRAYCGHGVGRQMHEDPQVPNFGAAGHGPRLEPGMVLAIEPMVNAGGHEVKVDPNGWTVRTVDGSLSAHCEHSVALTEDGVVILTRP
jgi:methionyl aminopeptidase